MLTTVFFIMSKLLFFEKLKTMNNKRSLFKKLMKKKFKKKFSGKMNTHDFVNLNIMLIYLSKYLENVEEVKPEFLELRTKLDKMVPEELKTEINTAHLYGDDLAEDVVVTTAYGLERSSITNSPEIAAICYEVKRLFSPKTISPLSLTSSTTPGTSNTLSSPSIAEHNSSDTPQQVERCKEDEDDEIISAKRKC